MSASEHPNPGSTSSPPRAPSAPTIDRLPSLPRAARRLTSHAVDDVAVSSLTVAELEYGVAKSRFGSVDRDRLDQFLTPLQILAFDDGAAQAYGPIRATLEQRGALIGPIDMLLAAHAVSLGAIMVTNSRAEFARIHGLVVEDWTRA